jgi:hypothetical protein
MFVSDNTYKGENLSVAVYMRVLIFIFLLTSNSELLAQKNNLERLKEFALEYEPTPQKGKTILEPIPISISTEFKNLRENGKKYEEHLALIFTKIYRYHLTCCHQSYEIRTNNTALITPEDPLVFELMVLTDIYPKGKHVELLTSAVILTILEEHPELLDYEPLSKELQEINVIKKKIENGDFWKD